MPVKIVYERPKIHREYSAVKSITMELEDERTLEEMQDGFDGFLKAMGFFVPSREEYTPPTFGDSDVSMVSDSYYDVNPDLTGSMAQDIVFDDSDTITLDLNDTYGTTTSNLKVD
jgi:hypothetical protein